MQDLSGDSATRIHRLVPTGQQIDVTSDNHSSAMTAPGTSPASDVSPSRADPPPIDVQGPPADPHVYAGDFNPDGTMDALWTKPRLVTGGWNDLT